MGRAQHLDATRGIAALSVAVFHFGRAFTPDALSGAYTVNQTLLSALWNGHFAVQVFFVLSGFLFFSKYSEAGIGEATAASVKRYLRLSLPVLAACLLAWAMHAAGLFVNNGAVVASGSDWLVRWYQFPPDVGLAIQEPLMGMYVSFDPLRSYNANLWTIQYELFGVCAVIAMACASRTAAQPMRLIVLVVAALLSAGTFYFPFVLGALAACLRRTLDFDIKAMPALVMILLCLSGASHFPIIDIAHHWVVFGVWPVCAAVMLIVVDASTALRRATSILPLQALGRLSFGLYLAHFVVVNSIAAAVYVSTGSLMTTFVTFLTASMMLAWAFAKFIDEPILRILSAVELRLLPRPFGPSLGTR